MKIPIAYQIMAKRLYDDSFCGRLAKARARTLLRLIYRMPSERINSIISEMCEFNLVKVEGTKSIIIKEPKERF